MVLVCFEFLRKLAYDNVSMQICTNMWQCVVNKLCFHFIFVLLYLIIFILHTVFNEGIFLTLIQFRKKSSRNTQKKTCRISSVFGKWSRNELEKSNKRR